MRYRPWGSMNWTLSLSDEKEWGFVGCHATEERSLCSWKLMKEISNLNGEFFFQVTDENSDKYAVQVKEELVKRDQDFIANGGDINLVDRVPLMSELFKIDELSHKALNLGESIVLDVTSMPKRFFFPILKKLINSGQVNNLLVTYSSPLKYTNGDLYEDIDSWKNLPGFGGITTERENLIVSIGFLVESLKSYFSSTSDHEKVNMLVPFPAPLSVLKRTWDSVSKIEYDNDSSRFEKYRIDTLDMSSAFNYIESQSLRSDRPTAFAPFGPKPISVAMCLYALQKNCSVYYPQPTVYHPQYSIGIKNDDLNSAVTAYWVMHDGENLYEVE